MIKQSIYTIGFGAMAFAASQAHASVILPTAPAGYSAQATLYGSEGVGQNASRWFSASDGMAQRTNWANERIDFYASLDASPSNYTVGVTAKNETPLVLSSNYSQFKVGVSVNDAFVDYMYIDASDEQWNSSYLNVGELSGDTKVTLNWTNDSYSPGNYDANISFGGLQFLTFGAQSLSLPMSPEIPAPGSGALAIVSLMFAAPRRRRRARAD